MFKRLKFYYCKWMMDSWYYTIKIAKKRHQYWSVKAVNALFDDDFKMTKGS